MGNLVLAGSTSGSTTITPSATGTYTITLPAETGTIQTSGAGFTTNGVAYASSTSALTTNSALTWSGTLLSATTNVNSNANVLSLINSNTAAGGCGVGISGYSSNGSNSLGSIQFGGNGSLGGNLDFSTANSSGTNTLNMRLTSSGYLLLGTTTAPGGSSLLTINSGNGIQYSNPNGGGVITPINAGGLQFFSYTGSIGSETYAERARIDSSGNLLIGTTSGAQKLIVAQAAAGTVSGYFISSSATTAYGIQITYTGRAPNSTGEEFIYCNDTSVPRFVVRSNGGIANYQANNVNLSDRREKTNFAFASSYLDKICAIPVRTFNYIDQNLEEDSGLTLGVVAQDVQAVAPELVTETNWGSKEEPKMRLSIYQTDLQYALMKSIQELSTLITAQQSTIQSLTERITALEGART